MGPTPSGTDVSESKLRESNSSVEAVCGRRCGIAAMSVCQIRPVLTMKAIDAPSWEPALSLCERYQAQTWVFRSEMLKNLDDRHFSGGRDNEERDDSCQDRVSQGARPIAGVTPGKS